MAAQIRSLEKSFESLFADYSRWLDRTYSEQKIDKFILQLTCNFKSQLEKEQKQISYVLTEEKDLTKQGLYGHLVEQVKNNVHPLKTYNTVELFLACIGSIAESTVMAKSTLTTHIILIPDC